MPIEQKRSNGESYKRKHHVKADMELLSMSVNRHYSLDPSSRRKKTTILFRNILEI